jgi:hypothetical protein
MLCAIFPAGVAPVIETTQRVATKDWTVNLSGAADASAGIQSSAGIQPSAGGRHATPAQAAEFLKPTQYVPTDGIVKTKAEEITKGAHTDV